MKVTYFGTAMLLFDDGESQLLFDCHTTRPSLVRTFAGKLKTDTAAADRIMAAYGMDRGTALFVSHTHYDHVMDMPCYAKKTACEVYGSASCLNVAAGGGVDMRRVHVFEDGGVYEAGKFRVRVMASRHSKPRFFNNDLGKTIDRPLAQPAGMRAYKEGGSYDFLVVHEGRNYLIRPSYNFIPGSLDGVSADVLFLGTTSLYRDSEERRRMFFEETIGKTRPKTVVPLHWDNFFKPLSGTSFRKKSVVDDPQKSFGYVRRYCEENGCGFLVIDPPDTAVF